MDCISLPHGFQLVYGHIMGRTVSLEPRHVGRRFVPLKVSNAAFTIWMVWEGSLLALQKMAPEGSIPSGKRPNEDVVR